MDVAFVMNDRDRASAVIERVRLVSAQMLCRSSGVKAVSPARGLSAVCFEHWHLEVLTWNVGQTRMVSAASQSVSASFPNEQHDDARRVPQIWDWLRKMKARFC